MQLLNQIFFFSSGKYGLFYLKGAKTKIKCVDSVCCIALNTKTQWPWSNNVLRGGGSLPMYAGVRGTSEWGLRRWVGFRVLGWGL